MSYTIVFDRAEQDRQACNIINKAVRHCRIGKVNVKARKPAMFPAPPFIGDFPYCPPHQPPIWTPNIALPIAWWQNPVVSTC